ncbi:nucleotide-sugar transporter-domain-containing protein [Hysterangium stoloniferum]|nr:nucleotide-sugar transporter-domain-containing protein [Hysterangium stoloniferum]
MNPVSSPHPAALHVLHALASDDDRIPAPSVYGVPLKYLSLVTLAVQNAALTIIMHTSRTTIPASEQYSAASAVLFNELLKGAISLMIAVRRVEPKRAPWRRIARDIFSPDCWKLSIPAILYVLQNNLQYVAATNLDAATFQVTYQMKILTTAAFSVLLLRRQLSGTRWLALFFLAVGVGIVQIQSGAGGAKRLSDTDGMNPLLGFLAVTAACFTSGLAGVYFEMILKGSQADLWVRNVQLSLFSLLPALLPALIDNNSGALPGGLFRNFGFWAWATVLTQVLGGLITAIVIKHADNILKGFATSLSIVLSFAASVFLFEFTVTPTFLVGAGVVLGSTWLYNHPGQQQQGTTPPGANPERIHLGLTPTSALGSPVDADAPILGQLVAAADKKRATALVTALAVLGMSPTPSPAPSRAHSPRPEHQALVAHPMYTPPPTRPPSPRPPSRLSSASTPYVLSRAGSSLDVSTTQR